MSLDPAVALYRQGGQGSLFLPASRTWKGDLLIVKIFFLRHSILIIMLLVLTLQSKVRPPLLIMAIVATWIGIIVLGHKVSLPAIILSQGQWGLTQTQYEDQQ